jgi:hypothetical protein
VPLAVADHSVDHFVVTSPTVLTVAANAVRATHAATSALRLGNAGIDVRPMGGVWLSRG